MCLAVPLKVIEINGREAIGEADGVTRHIRVDFIPDIALGEYVIVHAGFAIERLSAERAEENLETILEVADAARRI